MEFSTGAARLHSCTTLPKPGLQGKFLRSSGRLILGYADHYWSVSSLSENSSSSNVQDRPTYRAARGPRKWLVPKSVILFTSLLLLDTYCLSGWAYIAEYSIRHLGFLGVSSHASSISVVTVWNLAQPSFSCEEELTPKGIQFTYNQSLEANIAMA